MALRTPFTLSRYTTFLTEDLEAELADIANRLVAKGKGILTADESVATCGNRLKEANVENTEDNRRKYRQLLFSCSNLAEHISGVIMFDETARQSDSNGIPFLEILRKSGIIPGIKVDKGVVHLGGTLREFTTVGLDGLKERLDEYKAMGFQFAKWRSVLKVSKYTPSNLAMVENTNLLAKFASICQQSGMVPIVEPEVLSDGDHDLESARRVTEEVLAIQFKALADHHVFLEGILLRPNMVIPGQIYKGPKNSPQEIALATVQTMQRRVPAAVPGIIFSSGGQDVQSATLNLNEINKVSLYYPWHLTFCYGYALQASVLLAWQGKDENIQHAQQELITTAKANGLASMGQCVSNERCLVSESRQLKKEQSRFSYTYHDEQNWIRNIDENEHSHHSMPAPVEEKAAEKAAENVLQPLPSETQADA